MSVQINKDTKLYGSFSQLPGNNGCIFFNNAFTKYNINAIYKSFYSDNIEQTIQSVKHLKFSGFALSMPHKISVIKYLDKLDDIAEKVGSVNTVVLNDNKLTGYNTDYYGILSLFDFINVGKKVNIIGNGGFSKAIEYACKKTNIKCNIIERKDTKTMFNTIDEVFINATPAEFISAYNKVIDLRPHTHYGKMVAEFQAKHQFKLYTGIDYEDT